MNNRIALLGAAPAALFWIALSGASPARPIHPQEEPKEDAKSAAQGGLVPLTPEDFGNDHESSADALDVDQIAALLGARDLDQRERSFDRVVDRGRSDAAVRRLLRDLSLGSDRELAWTARLALRMVEERGLLDAPHGIDPLLPFALEPFRDLEALLRTPGLPSMPGLRPNLGLRGTGSGKSVEIRQDQDGFHLKIHERDEKGETQTREFEGESLDAILEANPELEQELDVLQGAGGFALRFGPSPLDDDLWQHFFGDNGRGAARIPLAPNDSGGLRRFLFPMTPSQPLRTDILGVRAAPVGAEQAERSHLAPGQGLYVDSVLPGTLAHLLDVGPGSILLTLNGRALARVEDISAALAARGEADEVTLTWIDPQGDRRSRTWSPPSKRSY